MKDPAQFKALYAYSPYHHVRDGTAYPAILFLTGENDHRVNAMQSREMTARLQAATSSNRPILLRTSSSAGHGIGTAMDEEIEQGAGSGKLRDHGSAYPGSSQALAGCSPRRKEFSRCFYRPSASKR